MAEARRVTYFGPYGSEPFFGRKGGRVEDAWASAMRFADELLDAGPPISCELVVQADSFSPMLGAVEENQRWLDEALQRGFVVPSVVQKSKSAFTGADWFVETSFHSTNRTGNRTTTPVLSWRYIARPSFETADEFVAFAAAHASELAHAPEQKRPDCKVPSVRTAITFSSETVRGESLVGFVPSERTQLLAWLGGSTSSFALHMPLPFTREDDALLTSYYRAMCDAIGKRLAPSHFRTHKSTRSTFRPVD